MANPNLERDAKGHFLPRDKDDASKIELVFVRDSDIPRRVKWDGYGRIRPWIATHVRDTYGCILSKCQIKWDPVKRGHWIKGPRKGTNAS